jgi:uncharacterized protein YdhG (YjbR/CyaY superfamily)
MKSVRCPDNVPDLKATRQKENAMTSAKNGSQKSPKNSAARENRSEGFTDQEQAALKARRQELRQDARRRGPGDKVDGESAVLAALAAMPQPDRIMGERLHRIIKDTAPNLSPKTWYGMPAYAKDGNVVCFFQSAQKFKTRYATLGFSDKAKLDDGQMWPTAFALKELGEVEEARIGALLAKAAS